MLKKILIGCAALLLVLTSMTGLVACQGTEKPLETTVAAEDTAAPVAADATLAPEATTVEMEKIGVAITIGTPHANPAVIADLKGYFKENGLEADLQTYAGGPAMMEALPSGTWDVCVVAIPGWMGGAKNYGLKIVGLGPWDTDGINLSVRPDSDIALAGNGKIANAPDIYGDASTWRGKNILLPTGTTAHMALLSTLDLLGLTESDVTITNMDVAAAFTAFKAGQGDVVGTWTLNSVYAANEGYIVASSAKATGMEIPIIICASEKVMQDNPGLVEKFLKAYAEGAKYQQENQDEAAQIMADFNNENGFKTDKDSCYALIKTRTTDSYADQLKMFQDGKIEQIVRENLDFFIKTGKYTEADWDVFKANISSAVLEKVQ